jgi:hypothetical protein
MLARGAFAAGETRKGFAGDQFTSFFASVHQAAELCVLWPYPLHQCNNHSTPYWEFFCAF